MATRVLFLENRDSFSWNVVDRLPVDRGQVHVVPGWDAARVDLGAYDLLVVGPGPMDPVRAGLVPVVREARIPTLGICLGHQAMGLAWGARLTRTRPAHGVVSQAHFSGSRLFPGFQGAVEVMRYHSLSLSDVVAPLHVVARTSDGTVMAVEHQALPLAGVQFHPDSFATPRGEEMLRAFFRSTSCA
jgi:anthranilate synthase/aminodeoxychorismate synthase-like glutamine amidotransferase